MSDLVCTKCGMKASYADAMIADIHRSCNNNEPPVEVEGPGGVVKFAPQGNKHNWREL